MLNRSYSLFTTPPRLFCFAFSLTPECYGCTPRCNPTRVVLTARTRGQAANEWKARTQLRCAAQVPAATCCRIHSTGRLKFDCLHPFPLCTYIPRNIPVKCRPPCRPPCGTAGLARAAGLTDGVDGVALASFNTTRAVRLDDPLSHEPFDVSLTDAISAEIVRGFVVEQIHVCFVGAFGTVTPS